MLTTGGTLNVSDDQSIEGTISLSGRAANFKYDGKVGTLKMNGSEAAASSCISVLK
jgi:hypothetical protein